MTPPATAAAAAALVRASRLVPDDRLRAALAGPPAGADEVFARLTAAGLLTPFHVEHLRAGRAKGFVLGKYTLLDRIGAGGMGQVYLAEHAGLGRRVAVKVLTRKAAGIPLARARFVREAAAAARVDHPNVVRGYDVEADADPPYLVMEYVDGVSLQAAVARHGPFAPAEAAAVGRQVLLGLHAAHAAGVVHRDVKPANILLDRQGTAKLTDLGIVRVEGEELTRMAGTPQILGTLDYLAPEQAADSSAVDGRADLYSLGATLYFLLAGRPPFAAAATASRKLALIRAAAPPPLDETRADLPPTLAAVVHRLLAKRPAERATAAEAADALGRSADPPAGFPARLFAPPTVARPARVAEADTLPCRPSAVTPPPGRAEPSDRRPKTDLQLPRT